MSHVKKIDLKYKPWLDYIILTGFLLLTYTFFLGSHPLFIPDEVRYSEVAREMLAQHQYLTPQLNGIDFFDKPILFYWLQVIAISIFGVNEWAIRFFPMLFGVAGVVIIFGTVKHIANRTQAWVAAIILATCPLYFFAAHYANLDLEVAVWITASLCAFIRAYDFEEKKLHVSWLYLSYLLSGLAILTKGLIGIAFPVIIISIWILWTRQWFLIKALKIPTGLMIILLVVLPWLSDVAYHNPGFLYYFFYIQQFLRFLTHSFNNIQPFWFYLPIILGGMLPWIVGFLDYSFYKHSDTSPLQSFLWIWVISILVFFSIPASKLIGYILPVLPPLAILLSGQWLKGRLAIQRKIGVGYILFLLLVFAFFIFMPSSYIPYPAQIGEARFILLSTALLLSFFLAYILYNTRPESLLFKSSSPSGAEWEEEKTHRFSLLIALAWTSLVIYNIILASVLLMPESWIVKYFPMTKIAAEIKPIIQSQDKVISYYDFFQALPITFQRPVYIVHDWNKPLIEKKDNWRGEFAYASLYLQPSAKQWLISDETLKIWWKGSERIFIWLTPHKLSQLEKSLNVRNPCIVSQANKMMVVTNDDKLCD